MHPLRLAPVALTVLALTACSTGMQGGVLDGPTTTITIAAAASDLDTQGVPFEDGVSVVESVSVTIFAPHVDEELALRFTLEDDLYSFDPEGDLTSITFPFAGSIDVALPAGNEYDFVTTGSDTNDVWLAYGETTADVDHATTSVRLALQTMIEAAGLETASPTTAVVPGEAIDLYLSVYAPGGYLVPVADFDVAYDVAAADGTLVASSNLGTRVLAIADPSGDTFEVAVTISGWRDVGGVATWTDGVTAAFEKPFAITSGIGLDTSAPTVTIDPVATGTLLDPLLDPLTLSGTASDDTGIDRLQVYEGPVLIGSIDPVESDPDGVANITLQDGSWTMDWTPTEARAHTITAVGIDAAGNEGRSSTTVDLGEPTTLTFVHGTYNVPATLTAGERVIIQGAAASGFDSTKLSITLITVSDFFNVSTAGAVVADGMWQLEWTAPPAGTYYLEYYYSDVEYGHFLLTVE